MAKIYYSNVGLPTLTEAQKEKAEADVKRLNEEMLQSHINRMKRRDQLAYNQTLQHSLQNPDTPNVLKAEVAASKPNLKYELRLYRLV